MSIKITVEKVVIRGEQKMIVKKIEGVLCKEQLPTKYVGESPSIWNSIDHPDKRIIDFYSNWLIRVGEEISERDLDYIKKSGQRLSEINKKLKEQNKDWHGRKEIV